MRRLIIVVLSAALLAGGAVVLPSVVTPTVASQARADEHHPDANGCSAVPDWGSNWNFHAACDRHDVCYVYHQKGEGEAGRKACDDQFYQDMAWSCRDKPMWWPRQDCFNVAWAYWRGVRAFGGGYWAYENWRWVWKAPFYDNWKPNRANTPMR